MVAVVGVVAVGVAVVVAVAVGNHLMTKPLRNREREIEREWHRIVWRERFQNIVFPCLLMVVAGGAAWWCLTQTALGKIFGALIMAIGMPLAMWMGKK